MLQEFKILDLTCFGGVRENAGLLLLPSLSYLVPQHALLSSLPSSGPAYADLTFFSLIWHQESFLSFNCVSCLLSIKLQYKLLKGRTHVIL